MSRIAVASRAHIRERSIGAANVSEKPSLRTCRARQGVSLLLRGWPRSVGGICRRRWRPACSTLVAIYLAGRASSRLPYLPVYLCPRFRPFSYSPWCSLHPFPHSSPVVAHTQTHAHLCVHSSATRDAESRNFESAGSADTWKLGRITTASCGSRRGEVCIIQRIPIVPGV